MNNKIITRRRLDQALKASFLLLILFANSFFKTSEQPGCAPEKGSIFLTGKSSRNTEVEIELRKWRFVEFNFPAKDPGLNSFELMIDIDEIPVKNCEGNNCSLNMKPMMVLKVFEIKPGINSQYFAKALVRLGQHEYPAMFDFNRITTNSDMLSGELRFNDKNEIFSSISDPILEIKARIDQYID